MSTLLQDVRFGWQLLARYKLFTTVALLTLALCIGANTAIFSVIDTILLRPLPYPDGDRIVMLYNVYPNVGVEKGSNGVPDYLDRRQATDVFESLALLTLPYFTIGTQSAPLRVSGMRATPSVFSVLRTVPELGRPFTDQEARIGSDQVVILGHGLWRDVFGGSSSVIDQEIRLDGVPYRVVGVMPANFDVLSREVSVIVPFAFTDQQRSDDARHSNFATMLGRLRDGVEVAQARDRVDVINARNAERFPQFGEFLANSGFETRVVRLHDEMVESIRPTLYLLQAGVLFVLLIGCVNIANLVLMRSNGRTQELAVRAAIGAGRGRLARQLLTESLLLASLGGVLGLLVAGGALRLLPLAGIDQLPRASELAIDGSAALFTLLTAVVTGVVFGVIPAAQVARGDLEQVLRQAGRAGSSGRSAAVTRGALVVAQVSMAFILLIGAGLMIVSFARVLSVDPGFRVENVLSTGVNLPRSRYAEPDELRAFADRARARVGSLPGVTGVGMTTMLPFSGDSNSSAVTIEEQPLGPGDNPPVPHFNRVDESYFSTMGIPLHRGRFFGSTDSPESLRVAVIDRHMAERYWPDQSPLGKRVRVGVGDIGVTDESQRPPWLTIVGVVGNVAGNDLAAADDVGTVYLSQRQFPQRASWLVVRSTLPEAQLTSAVRRAVQSIDPELPLYFDTKMLSARLDASLLGRRAPMALLLVFAGIALFLSAVGIYGVLAHSVSQRTREIGIRIALGAEPAEVMLQTLWRGGKLVGLGMVVGLLGAVWLGRLVSSLLYGVTPTDPGVFALVLVVLGGVALIACLIPSRRATRVDAVTALRHD